MVSPSARERFDAARLINIANGLTAARVLLVPYFAYLLISGQGEGGAAGVRRLRGDGRARRPAGPLAAAADAGRGRSSTRSPTSC